ncbi:hypothetical protein [Cellulophaga sp. Hel_I_12]|uniref:hypothetical protein n=1 Tax=Cellulophaga sp. Hel_I_12 TaxID=1249972 RepID=UPI000689254D|nr:hypothetical protein [Cellulophaga sp. Hel_I_12]
MSKIKNLKNYRVLLFILSFTLFITSCKGQNKSTIEHTFVFDTLRIKNDLKTITQTTESRNHKNIKTLNHIADFIQTELAKVCDSVSFQEYKVGDETYKNVIGSLNSNQKEWIIIGTHYDVFGEQ